MIEFKFALENYIIKCKTNKNKSTEIYPPLLIKPPYICARAMPRAKKTAKVQILKKTTVLCWSVLFISL